MSGARTLSLTSSAVLLGLTVLLTGPGEAVSAQSSAAASGGKIAFLRFISGKPEYLDVVNSSGSGLKALREVSGFVDRISWSPDGQRVAFSTTPSSGVGGSVLYVMRADGRGLRKLARGFSSAAWSPDGTKIAAAGPGGIFVMTPTGTGRTRLIAGRASAPAWSPNGQQIAFVKQLARGGTALEVANSDGSNQVELIGSCPPQCSASAVIPAIGEPPAATDQPSWAPDGKAIAFELGVFAQGKCHGCFLTEIAVIGSDGAGVKLLTPVHPPLANESPTWSPDGQKIAFTRALCFPKSLCFPHDGNTRTALDVMNADGSEAKAITRGALVPAWQP